MTWGNALCLSVAALILLSPARFAPGVWAGEGEVPSSQSEAAALAQEGPHPVAPRGAGVMALRYEGERVFLEATDAALEDVLARLSEISGVEIRVQEGVVGRLSLRLEGVLLEEGVRGILRAAGEENYALEHERAGPGAAPVRIHVLPRGKEPAALAGEGSPASGGEAMAPGVERLLEVLRTGTREQTKQALLELLGMGKEGQGVLVASLSLPRPELFPTVLRLLWELDAREAGPQAAALLGAEDVVVRRAAAKAVGFLGYRQALPLLVEGLEKTGGDAATRCVFLWGLGNLGGEEARVAIGPHASDEDPMVQACAAGALGLTGSGEGLERALHLARTGDASVQNLALQALGQIGDPRALPLLDEVASGPEARHRDTAHIARRRIQLAGASTEHKRELLAEDMGRDGLVPSWAAGQLARIGDPESIEILKAHALDRRGRLRPAVESHLRRFGVRVEAPERR